MDVPRIHVAVERKLLEEVQTLRDQAFDLTDRLDDKVGELVEARERTRAIERERDELRREVGRLRVVIERANEDHQKRRVSNAELNTKVNHLEGEVRSLIAQLAKAKK